MNIFCSICRDQFSGQDNETIFTTKCGHVFHHQCILQWIERSKTCPHCRTALTKNGIFKLNFYSDGEVEPRTGLEDCRERNLSFELSMKKIEIQQLKETSRIAVEQTKGLRQAVKRLEDEARTKNTMECNLREEIRCLKAQQNQPHRFFNDDVIVLDDSIQEPELIEIDMDSSRTVVNHGRRNNEGAENLNEEIVIKEALLGSALSRITELEKENNVLKNHLSQEKEDLKRLQQELENLNNQNRTYETLFLES